MYASNCCANQTKTFRLEVLKATANVVATPRVMQEITSEVVIFGNEDR